MFLKLPPSQLLLSFQYVNWTSIVDYFFLHIVNTGAVKTIQDNVTKCQIEKNDYKCFFCLKIYCSLLQLLLNRVGWEEILNMMYKLCAALLFAGAAILTPVPEPGHGHHEEHHYPKHNNLQCFSKPYKKCHKEPQQNHREVCHEEYDVIVDTTYIEECE